MITSSRSELALLFTGALGHTAWPSMATVQSTNLELIGLAWSLGWRISAGLLVGYWLDSRLGTGPWLTLGLTLGAFWGAVMQILKVLRARATARPGR